MALNVKILLDPKSYYQKLKELAAKSTQAFSRVGSDVKKVFSSVRSGVSGATASFGTFIKSVLRGGGAFSLIEKGCLCFFSVFDAHMKKLKEQITDAIESIRSPINSILKAAQANGPEKGLLPVIWI